MSSKKDEGPGGTNVNIGKLEVGAGAVGVQVVVTGATLHSLVRRTQGLCERALVHGAQSEPNGFHNEHVLLRARDWQDRGELGNLCKWWHEGHRGICSLVGIGGAGKTALVDRFLQLLAGGVGNGDESLSIYGRVLVYSFYDAPNPEDFFTAVGKWLRDEQATAGDESTSAFTPAAVTQMLARAGPILLVLDGLEKVQDDGLLGPTFGTIQHGGLRSLLMEIMEGELGEVSTLLTSRFPLYDAHASDRGLHTEILVEELPLSVAVQLLRARGAMGTDLELEQIAEACGRHALSVDLFGGFLARFHAGSARALPPLHDLTVGPEEAAVDGRLKRLRDQERRFARIAQRYREAFASYDAAALALLERIALFRTGVAAETLAAVFLGKDRERISGPHLAVLDQRQLLAKLHLLSEMRLIEPQQGVTARKNGAKRSAAFAIHPAVRAGFLQGLGRETSAASHKAVSDVLKISLGGLPDTASVVTDPADRALLEEILFHTFEAGDHDTAWDIFDRRLGGWLGARDAGEYNRFHRICRILSRGLRPNDAPIRATVPSTYQIRFLINWGHCLVCLGMIAEAVECYERSFREYMIAQNKCRAYTGLTFARLHEGRVVAAREASEKGLTFAGDIPEEVIKLNEDLAWLCGASGDTAEMRRYALASQAALEAVPASKRSKLDLGSAVNSCFTTRFLCRTGALELAKAAIAETAPDGETSRAQRCLNQAEIACGFLEQAPTSRGISETRRQAESCLDWATSHEERDLLCGALLILARIQGWEAIQGLQADVAGRWVERDRTIAAGLRHARQYGFGIFHLEFLIQRAIGEILGNQLDRADETLRAILYGRRLASPGENPYEMPAQDQLSLSSERGIFPPNESGLPPLVAATHPDCGYWFAERKARTLLATSGSARRGDPVDVISCLALCSKRIAPPKATVPSFLQRLKDWFV